jgi:hypothetical protein
MPSNNQTSKKPPTEIYRREGRNWLILLGLIVAALLVSAAIALGGRWVYREFVKDEPGKSAPEIQGANGTAGPESSGAEETQSVPSTEGANTGGQDDSSENLPVTGG